MKIVKSPLRYPGSKQKFCYTFKKILDNSKNVAALLSEDQLKSIAHTVVTGYDVVNKKTIQMTHPINDDILQKILQAHELHLRYYVGPNAINSEIKGTKLRNIKKWILK